MFKPGDKVKITGPEGKELDGKVVEVKEIERPGYRKSNIEKWLEVEIGDKEEEDEGRDL